MVTKVKTYNSSMSEISLKFKKSDFQKVKITKSKDAVDVIRQFYHDDISIYESVFILLLNRANNTIGYAKISQGGTAGTVVDVKIVAKFAVDGLASGVIMAHNHPSGNTQPSKQDKDLTEQVKNGLKLLDVQLLDHIILTENDFYSLADEGDIF
jgi:DNA repair protein RadC